MDTDTAGWTSTPVSHRMDCMRANVRRDQHTPMDTDIAGWTSKPVSRRIKCAHAETRSESLPRWASIHRSLWTRYTPRMTNRTLHGMPTTRLTQSASVNLTQTATKKRDEKICVSPAVADTSTENKLRRRVTQINTFPFASASDPMSHADSSCKRAVVLAQTCCERRATDW